MDKELLKDGIIPLLEAFKSFEKNSNSWQLLYRKLEKSFDGLRDEFENQNQELKESLQKNLVLKNYLLQIIDNIDVAIIVYNPKKEIVFVNCFAVNFFEKDAKSLIGYNGEEILNSWFEITNLQQTFTSEKNITKESVIYKENFMEYSNICIFSDDENSMFDNWLGVIQICYDVTKIHKKQKQQFQSQNETSLNLMMSNISHEIKNPLLGISTYLEELACMDCNKNNPQAANMLKKSRKGLTRIDEIIKSVIEFEKFAEPTFVRYDLMKVITYVIQGLKNSKRGSQTNSKLQTENFGEKRIEFVNNIGQKNLFLEIDIFAMKKAITNIISNSIDSIVHSGKIVINANYDSWKNCCSLFIHDTGGGIEKKNMSYIFDPFFSTYPNKIGLGLTFAKKVVENHKGTFKVNSDSQNGTTFEIELPIIQKVDFSDNEKGI
ncbi:MAG: HAMP domain-containing sensor histidine kinase [Candidatus Cloacimonadota bacterium]|nr:HAMP domain-containing sensor histidine kinase [Candidatus Cloacimonadota bacterium]